LPRLAASSREFDFNATRRCRPMPPNQRFGTIVTTAGSMGASIHLTRNQRSCGNERDFTPAPQDDQPCRHHSGPKPAFDLNGEPSTPAEQPIFRQLSDPLVINSDRVFGTHRHQHTVLDLRRPGHFKSRIVERLRPQNSGWRH
jgi:hypothetical protein